MAVCHVILVNVRPISYAYKVVHDFYTVGPYLTEVMWISLTSDTQKLG